MTYSNRFFTRLCLLLVVGGFAAGAAVAQDEEGGDNTKTKQAQAVSKEFYDRIQKAQEEIDADNQQEALQILERLKTRKGITEYELHLRYFIHAQRHAGFPFATQTIGSSMAVRKVVHLGRPRQGIDSQSYQVELLQVGIDSFRLAEQVAEGVDPVNCGFVYQKPLHRLEIGLTVKISPGPLAVAWARRV